MGWLTRWKQHPWWMESLAITGLLLAIAVVGLVGLGINARVKHITERMVQYDIEVGDRSDDFRVAVLEMRHYHHNILFAGPTLRRVVDFKVAYGELLTCIEQLDQLPTEYLSTLRTAELRTLAEQYYHTFYPAFEHYSPDRQLFDQASEESLWLLAELENVGRRLEQLGEQQEATGISSVEAAINGAQWVLLAVLGGVILMGAGLAYQVMHTAHERQQAAAKLTQALHLKNNFIADASHELRTPLTVLRANAEVALELERACVHTEFLTEILRESERMTALIEDLLLLARSDAGSIPLDLAIVELEPFLAELAERASMLAHKQGVLFYGELLAAGHVRIDRARIEQAVLILVDNAAKYSLEDKPILLRSATDSKTVIIEVIDQGVGIPSADLPFIFERFYRVDKARSRKQGGTGLGLAIAKSLIEAHGGRIEAESVLHQGTQMRLSLPLYSPV